MDGDLFRKGRILVLTALGLVGLLLAWRIRVVLTPFLFALIITYLLAPWVDRLEAYVGRTLAILLVYLWLGVVGWLVLGYFLPPLIAQVGQAAGNFPQYAREGEALLRHWEGRYHRVGLPRPIRNFVEGLWGSTAGEMRRAGLGIWQAFLGFLPALLALLVSPILAYYFLKDLNRLRRYFWASVPPDHSAEAAAIIMELDGVLSGFIRGQLVVAAFVGAMAAGILYALGVPFALLIGTIAGVTDVIPYLGPLFGAIPAVLAALTRSPNTALWVAVSFFALHQVEGTIITPRVIGGRVGLHPLLIILALLVGGELWGIVGMLLAVPLAGVLRIGLSRLATGLLAPKRLGGS